MFEIKYSFSNYSNPDVATANEMALRYNLFLGSLTFKKGFKTISIDWDWIPLLDFAICLLVICSSLLKKIQGEEEFEFTESDAKIVFKKNGQYVEVFTTFSNEILEMNFEDFQKAVRRFFKDLIFDILAKNEELRKNQVFLKYLNDAQKI